MPTNLYGPGDNYHLEHSHVLPALLYRFYRAKCAGEPEVMVWGTGKAKREFLHVDDLADGLLFLLDHYHDAGPINIGSSEEITIAQLAEMIAGVVGYDGEIVFDTSKPDGTPRKKSDTQKMKGLGWEPKIGLREGVESTFEEMVRAIEGKALRLV